VEPKGKGSSERFDVEHKAILIKFIWRSVVYEFVCINVLGVKIDMIKCRD
jgi:hypothetical protein